MQTVERRPAIFEKERELDGKRTREGVRVEAGGRSGG